MPGEWYCGYVAYLVRVCARLDVPDDAADMLSDARGTSREHVPTLFFIALHLLACAGFFGSLLITVTWLHSTLSRLGPALFGGMPLVRAGPCELTDAGYDNYLRAFSKRESLPSG